MFPRLPGFSDWLEDKKHLEWLRARGWEEEESTNFHRDSIMNFLRCGAHVQLFTFSSRSGSNPSCFDLI